MFIPPYSQYYMTSQWYRTYSVTSLLRRGCSSFTGRPVMVATEKSQNRHFRNTLSGSRLIKPKTGMLQRCQAVLVTAVFW